MLFAVFGDGIDRGFDVGQLTLFLSEVCEVSLFHRDEVGERAVLVLQVGHVHDHGHNELCAEVCEFRGLLHLPFCNLGVVGLLVLCQLGLVLLAAFSVFGFDFGILGSVGGFDVFQLFLQLCQSCHLSVIL